MWFKRFMTAFWPLIVALVLLLIAVVYFMIARGTPVAVEFL